MQQRSRHTLQTTAGKRPGGIFNKRVAGSQIKNVAKRIAMKIILRYLREGLYNSSMIISRACFVDRLDGSKGTGYYG